MCILIHPDVLDGHAVFLFSILQKFLGEFLDRNLTFFRILPSDSCHKEMNGICVT